MANVETKNRLLTDEEIIEEYKFGDNNGILEFARCIELMTINKLNEQESTIINLRADVTLLTEIIRDLEGKNRGLENSRNFIMNVLKQ